MSPPEIRGSLLARNTLLNFIGQAVPLLVEVVTIPFIVRGLGIERFGLLSLAWVILGYFTIFDLGLGRATTKFVAEALGKGDEVQVPRLIWTAVTVQAVLGLMGSLVLVGITPLLAGRILNISPGLVGEAKTTFHLLALSVPVVLVSGSFSGVLEAGQRFDLVNAVRIPSSISTSLLTLVGLFLGSKLPGIVALILVARFGALLALVALVLQIFPKARKFSTHFALFPKLFAFGSWVTVTSVAGPVLVYFDRFLIASLLSMAVVAYYSVPYQAITRLWIIPTSLVMSLFPAFSALELEGTRNRQKLGTLFTRSCKYVLLALGPVVLMIILFAKEILQGWLGSDFTTQSKTVMQILALGVLAGALAHVPYTLLQGAGRPDITAKLHILELPLYMGTAWVLVNRWGIAGAATSWTLRVALDAILLFVATSRISRLSPRFFAANGLALTSLSLLLLAGMGYGLKNVASSLPLFGQSVLFVLLFSLFAWVVWLKVIDASDRDAILGMMKQ